MIFKLILLLHIYNIYIYIYIYILFFFFKCIKLDFRCEVYFWTPVALKYSQISSNMYLCQSTDADWKLFITFVGYFFTIYPEAVQFLLMTLCATVCCCVWPCLLFMTWMLAHSPGWLPCIWGSGADWLRSQCRRPGGPQGMKTMETSLSMQDLTVLSSWSCRSCSSGLRSDRTGKHTQAHRLGHFRSVLVSWDDW